MGPPSDDPEIGPEENVGDRSPSEGLEDPPSEVLEDGRKYRGRYAQYAGHLVVQNPVLQGFPRNSPSDDP